MAKLKVFLSSTMEDMKDERFSLAAAINNHRSFEAVFADDFVARSASSKVVCLQEVKNSDIYIGIFKNLYGFIPKMDNLLLESFVVMEYKEARRNKLPIFIFINKNGDDREEKLKEFIKNISDFDEGHWRKEYSTIDELVNYALDAIESELVELYKNKKNIEMNKRFGLPYFERLKENLK